VVQKFIPDRVVEVETEASRRARARRRERFVQIPLAWVDRLQTSGRGSTYQVAIRLLLEHWRNHGQPVKLANVTLAKAGVLRASKWRALRELEQLGLIAIERRPGKAPLVSPILNPI
jgi:hypothetical protein